jgi:hypothetical protein
MRSLTLLMAFSALTVIAVPMAAAAAQCVPCEPVNDVCRRVLKADCLASGSKAPAAPSTAVVAASVQPCSGGLCDTINAVCHDCIPAESQARCMGEPCDLVNRFCHCLG